MELSEWGKLGGEREGEVNSVLYIVILELQQRWQSVMRVTSHIAVVGIQSEMPPADQVTRLQKYHGLKGYGEQGLV